MSRLYRAYPTSMTIWRPQTVILIDYNGNILLIIIMKRDHGISENISVILIIAMVVILAFVVALSLMGFNIFQQKSAYISADINKQTLSSGKEVISVFNRGGDTAYLNADSQPQYQMSVYVDDTTMGSV